jgi:hypothetical protein
MVAFPHSSGHPAALPVPFPGHRCCGGAAADRPY